MGDLPTILYSVQCSSISHNILICNNTGYNSNKKENCRYTMIYWPVVDLVYIYQYNNLQIYKGVHMETYTEIINGQLVTIKRLSTYARSNHTRTKSLKELFPNQKRSTKQHRLLE